MTSATYHAAGVRVRELPIRIEKLPSTKFTRGGEVKIIDSKVFPVTPIAAAIVRLKPGRLRELHWHPNQDEWQYYISGKGRMTVFEAGSRARTMDFEEATWDTSFSPTPLYREYRRLGLGIPGNV
jgi:oxalate decarboxylase